MTPALTQAHPPTPGPPRMSTVALALLAGLLLQLLRELWLAPTGRGTLLVLTVPPLLLCVRGMWLHRMLTFRWLSLLVWLYVALAALRATTEAGASRTLAVVELGVRLVVRGRRAVHPAPAAQRGGPNAAPPAPQAAAP